MSFALPKLYVIADLQTIGAHGLTLTDFARQLKGAGVSLVQFRDKAQLSSSKLSDVAILCEELPDATILLNDDYELVSTLKAHGVHLGQSDTPIAHARLVLDREFRTSSGEHAMIGLSTHTDEEVKIAEGTSANYLAIGPVFATTTKPDAAPVVGLEGVRRARALTRKPLVAIGGITRVNCRSVIEAGADSVAVISALFSPGETVEQVAREYLRLLG